MDPDDIFADNGPDDSEDTVFIDTSDDSSDDKKSGSKSNPSDDRLRAAEDELANLRQQVQLARQQSYGPGYNQQNYTPPPDPYAAEEQAINDQTRALAIQYEAERAAGKMTAAKHQEYDQKARQFESRKMQIAAERTVANALPVMMQQTQIQSFRQQYQDVYDHSAARQYAKGTYDQLIAMGEPDSPATVEKAANMARIQFRLGGANMKPTDLDRQKLTGFSTRANTNSSDTTVKMDKSAKLMAMAMYGDALNHDEKKVYEKWAKGPGLKAKKAYNKAKNR